MNWDILDNIILPSVTKPTRYSGGEWNSICKNWDEMALHFAMVFPDTYEIGMSNIGIQILYDILNKLPDVACERAFAPWIDMENELRTRKIPLFSLETRHFLKDFDAIGFSLGYEFSETNVLNILDLSGIPIKSAEREESDPIIVAGGSCCYNPEPMSDFIDAFAIGEGEEIITEMAEALKPHASGKESRLEALIRLAGIPGIYVPAFYDVSYNPDGTVASISPNREGIPSKIQKRFLSTLKSAPYPEKPIVPFCEVVHDRIALEIMRGCSRGCRFCQAGMIYRPVREKPISDVEQIAKKQLKNTGHEEISLVSLSSADHKNIQPLISNLLEKYSHCGIGISLPSLRADSFSVNLASQIQTVRKSGLTLAPEAGTQRLRDVINKNVVEEDLINAVSAAFDAGWRTVKLYFMIGLPTETDEDILGIAKLASQVGDLARKKHIAARIHLSVSSFVPKPDTPFQWFGQDTQEELARKQELLRNAIHDRWINLSWHEPMSSFLEAVLSRGDRKVGKAIYRAWQLGCKLDGWKESFHPDLWMQAFDDVQIDPAFYANRTRTFNEYLPWDHIDCGVEKKFLIAENLCAKEGKITSDCRWDSCSGCGICSKFDTAPEVGDEKWPPSRPRIQ